MSDITLSKKAIEIKLGIYEHYKRKQYEVIGVVIHSETLEELVLYKALYGEKLTWVRPFNMFFEKVKINGVTQPRFKFLKKK